MRDLTDSEAAVVQALGNCFNQHQALDVIHPADAEEFCHAIHAAQDIVLARPAKEQTYRPHRDATCGPSTSLGAQ